MDAYIKGEMIMMADSVVSAQNKEVCRSNTNIDFENLVGNWVPHAEFNKYMEALANKVGKIGPQIAGRQAGATLTESIDAFSVTKDPIEGASVIPGFYKECTKGDDSGELIIDEISDGFLRLISTSKINEVFYLGVLEGFLRYYKKIVTKSDITETFEKNGRNVFELTWKCGLAH